MTLNDEIDAIASNPEQMRAFGASGNCVVLAPPGSGKTKLLAARVGFDLKNHIEAPRGAACLTLTNAAARELRERVGRTTSLGRQNVFIGTVHAFALEHIIRPYAHLVTPPSAAGIGIASKCEIDEIRKGIFERLVEPGEGDEYLWATVDMLRQSMADDEAWSRFGERPIEARDAYFSELDARGIADFLRLIEFAVDLVERDELIRSSLVAAFPRIYVDEYQDLAPGLDRIIRLLCFSDCGPVSQLFAVGDPDQAIYGFTGTNHELLVEVSELPTVSVVRLAINYRSGKSIVDASESFLNAPRGTQALREGGRVAAVCAAGGIESQLDFVSSRILSAIAAGGSASESAVFAASNRDCVAAVDALRAKGIATWVRPDELWHGSLPLAVEELCRWLAFGRHESGVDLQEVVDRIMFSVGGRNRGRSDALLDAVFGIEGDDPASGLVEAVRNSLWPSGAPSSVPDTYHELGAMLHELSVGRLRGASVREVAERNLVGDRVMVTTYSSSKGLEFDRVFVIGVMDGTLPFFKATTDREMIEERNKFYVVLTRARHEVYFLWSPFKETRFGRRASYISRFVEELGVSGLLERLDDLSAGFGPAPTAH